MIFLAKIKLFLKDFYLLDQFCHLCGRKAWPPWHTSNELWIETIGIKLSNGGIIYDSKTILCIKCFDHMARKKGIDLVWTAKL